MLTEDARSALRSSLRARRLALSVAQRMAAADGVLGSLSQLAEFQVDERIAGYWAIAGELPLHRVVADAVGPAQGLEPAQDLGPRAIAQVGRQVEASVAAGKARVDAFENEATGGAAANAE